MKLYGKDMNKADVLRRVGDLSQIGGVRSYTLNSGKAKGINAFEVNTGAGLRFTLLADRCLDIAWADFKGVPVGFIAKPGVSSSTYFEHRQMELHRVFAPGLLTTCGLRNVGAACDVDGEHFAQHGRIANAPAEDVSVHTGWEGDEYTIRVGGRMRESVLYDENLVLEREISTRLGSTSFKLTDSIWNLSFRDEQFAIVYHINFGYPVVAGQARVDLPAGKILGDGGKPLRDWSAELGCLEEPTDNLPHGGYMLGFTGSAVKAAVINEELEGFRGMSIRYDKGDLHFMGFWRSMASGDYVVGLEPGTAPPAGRKSNLEHGLMRTLKPMECFRTQIDFAIEM
jgi:hypothetical protein